MTDSLLTDLTHQYGTPLYVYDLDRIAKQIETLRGFDVIRYAQKANANLALLSWINQQGVQIDAVSAWEILRALKAGFAREQIVFTSDLFDQAALDVLKQHHGPVNLGSPDMIDQYAELHPGAEITLRINPGFGHGHDAKVTTGGEGSKHGIWHEHLPDILAQARAANLTVTGVHMHIGSGSDFTHLGQVRDALFTAAMEVGEPLKMMSVGGGLPVPYHPDDVPFAVEAFVDAWLETKAQVETKLGHTIRMEVEPGRYLVAECGVLLTEVRGTKSSGNVDYILVDAGFNNLIRPALYGAYHHLSILGKGSAPTFDQVVAGPLCESADVFTQAKGGLLKPVPLPKAEVGDIVCIHDAGAYAATMASNYNSKPLAAEVLLDNGAARLVRRRQTFDELIATEIY